MRPSKLNPDQLIQLFNKIGIKVYNPKIRIMNTRLPEKSYDYVFERVIERRGFFLMTYPSLKEWENDHPGMIRKLKAKGIETKMCRRHIKFTINGSGYLSAN